MPSIGLAWRQVRDRFREAALDTPDLDARLLGQAAFGTDAMGLVRREREATSPEHLETLDQLADRRLAGEPISRILGEKEFWSLPFSLSEATLVPRPETEMLVAETVQFLASRPSPRIVDLGTGSGAIAISILAELPTAKATATDISEAALATARQNAERHGVAGRIDFRLGPWWQAVPPNETFDVIVSNPPYIASAVIPGLAPEVRLFDPLAALDGGWDGLEAYRAISTQAARRLTSGGMVLLEIGSTQGATVSRIMTRAGLGKVEILKDMAGLDRVVIATHS